MSVSKHTEAQIIGAPKQPEAGRKAELLGRSRGRWIFGCEMFEVDEPLLRLHANGLTSACH